MNLNPPKISVVTIVKDNAELLKRAVKSVITQNFYNFEYIIVNDGSTDETKSIIDNYAQSDNRIKTIHMQKNQGRATARNAGLEIARGTYVIFLDSDDYFPENTFVNLYNVAEEDDADIVFGQIKCFDQATGKWLKNHYTHKIINKERHNIRLVDHLDIVDYHHIVGRLFKRSLLKEHNIEFNTDRKNGEDVTFSFFTSYHAESITMVPQTIVYYYSLGNYLAKANECKLCDARDNIYDTIKFALKYGNDPLKIRMLKKGVIFAGSLERAQKVYENDVEKFKLYLTTLMPFVKGITDDIIDTLPKYFKDFAIAMISYNFGEALLIWMKRNSQRPQKEKSRIQRFKNELQSDLKRAKSINGNVQEIERLRNVNYQLAYNLDRIYKSRSWRITAPMRKIARAFNKICKIKRTHHNKNKTTPLKYQVKELKKGLDLSYDLNHLGFGIHRSGWNFALHSLKPLHNPQGLYVVSFMEKVFVWGKPKPIKFPRPWIGFTHRPHNIPEWFPADLRRLFFQNVFFEDNLPSCKGIFTLSKYHAKHLAKQLSVPVQNLIHPTEIPEEQWNPNVLSTSRIKVVQVGWWLRKLHGIFMLPSGDYEKIYLTKQKIEKPIERIIGLEYEHLKRKGVFLDSMYDTAKTVNYLPNNEYDALLANSVIFLDLYDASANNAIIEAIARATPILVNPLEPVIEYLGEDYPLFYNSYDEGVEKLHNKELLLTAHEYLKKCDARKKITESYFKESIESSSIYIEAF